MLVFGKTKLEKEIFYGAKNAINILVVNVNNIVIPILTETTFNSKYLIGYLDEVIKPLALILSKISGYAKTLKNKDGNRNNKLMFFPTDYENLFKNI